MTEVFVMDARGLNVAASDVTSDYWQGDEEKFSETFPKGPETAISARWSWMSRARPIRARSRFPIVDPARIRCSAP